MTARVYTRNVSEGDAGSDADERLGEGARAGEYVIEAHVGAGAMGDVYRARHPVIGKRVAIKVIKRRLAGSAEALERFVREARAVNKIEHANVVDVFAMGRLDDGRLWLAMSYVEGESLGRKLRRDGPLPLDQLPSILRPVCEALAAAHAQGVIHRDLKTDNIFLGGRVYVLDFGIAKVLADVAAETGASRVTAEGAWVGTPAYMAPEQWSGEPVSARTDVYALGIVIYEMLTGQPPFHGTSLPSLMEQHFRAPPAPLSTATGGLRVPEALEAAVVRALAKRPEDRPAGALELLAMVETALGVTGAGRGAASATVAGTASPRPRAGHTRLLLAGGAVGAGALALALTLALGHRRDPPRRAPEVVGSGATVTITSTPSGADLVRDGALIGHTPGNLRAPAGAQVTLELRKPGYHAARRAVVVAPELTIDVPLTPLEEYEGVWRIPSHELRRFEFAGDYIEGYALATVDDPEPYFLRRFEYQAQEGELLTFAASEPHVEDAAPDEPSCRFPLATEYRFDAAHDTLEQRRQRVSYELRGGRCVALPGGSLSPAWTAWESCQRLARGAGPTVAESSAGASALEKPFKPSRAPGPSKAAMTKTKKGKPSPPAALPDQNAPSDLKAPKDAAYDKNAAYDQALQERNLDQRSKENAQSLPMPQAQQQAPPPQKTTPPVQTKGGSPKGGKLN